MTSSFRRKNRRLSNNQNKLIIYMKCKVEKQYNVTQVNTYELGNKSSMAYWSKKPATIDVRTAPIVSSSTGLSSTIISLQFWLMNSFVVSPVRFKL